MSIEMLNEIMYYSLAGSAIGFVILLGIEYLFFLFVIKNVKYPTLYEAMYREHWKHVWWFFKCITGIGSVYDGSICWFSKKFWNVHDYPVRCGGDGTPWHMDHSNCSKCGGEFSV